MMLSLGNMEAPGDRSIKSRGGTGKMRSRQPSSGGKRAQGQNMRHETC